MGGEEFLADLDATDDARHPPGEALGNRNVGCVDGDGGGFFFGSGGGGNCYSASTTTREVQDSRRWILPDIRPPVERLIRQTLE